MRKKHPIICAFTICIVLLCAGCRGEQAITEEYVKKIEPEARQYFEELAETAINEIPETITIEFQFPSKDFAKKKVEPIEKIISGYPVLLIGYGEVTEQQINDILKEAANRGFTVHFCFNGDKFRIYKAENGVVTVDEVTGRDGGAYHNESEYVFD